MTLAIVSQPDGTKQYQYVDSYEIMDAQLTQAQASYNPLGATATKGCANCNWFIAPGRCVVVAGEISPTGLSDLWRPEEADVIPPILVQIVNPSDATMSAPTTDTKAAGDADTHARVADHPRTQPDHDPKDPKSAKRKRAPAGHAEPTTQDNFYTSVKGALVPVRQSTDAADGLSRSSLTERMLSAVKSALIPFSNGTDRVSAGAHPVLTAPAATASPSRFALVAQKDGRTRFFTAWSNNFTDREGEIFPEYAHKEYIEWADRSQQYPELWLWHTKGTKYGQVDWLDYTDGFVFASGLIDAGFEDLAETLSKEDCGVSHGFAGLQRGNEIIQYRSFELSTLPRTNAAVWTTSFNIIGEGAKEMAFTQQKKTWLKEHGLDDAAIAAAETQATSLSKSLRDLGIAYKDTDLVEEPVTDDKAKKPPFGSEQADEEEDAADAKKKKAAKDAEFQSVMLTNSTKQTEILSALATSVSALSDRLKAVEATDDQKIAATIAARAPGSAGVSAAKDATNVVDQQQVSADAEFFGSTFLAGLGVTAGATGQ